MIHRHAQLDVAKVSGTQIAHIAAGDAQFFCRCRCSFVGCLGGGAEERIVQSTWKGRTERIVGHGGGNFADGSLADFVIGVDGELDGGGPRADDGLVDVCHNIVVDLTFV